MPTGYTADIYDGKRPLLDDLLAQFARGMGAYVMQRDDGPKEPLKPRTVSDYEVKAVERAEEELLRLEKMTESEKRSGYAQYLAEISERYQKDVEQFEARSANYDRYIKAVESVDWPTDEPGVIGEFFTGYKQFVVSQLKDSKEFDCHEPRVYASSYANAQAWYMGMLSSARDSVVYRKDRLEEEKKRVAEQNLVHNRLREFLDSIAIHEV